MYVMYRATHRQHFRNTASYVLRTNKHACKTMVFIVLHNDCQYTNNSPEVIGAFDDYNTSCLFGWKTIIEVAQRPWTVRHYKNRKGEFADYCGLGSYYIEEWDTTTSKRIKTISLGEDKKKYVLDKYLKEHYKEYNTIVQNWCIELESNIIPSKLQEFTFVY